MTCPKIKQIGNLVIYSQRVCCMCMVPSGLIEMPEDHQGWKLASEFLVLGHTLESNGHTNAQDQAKDQAVNVEGFRCELKGLRQQAFGSHV